MDHPAIITMIVVGSVLIGLGTYSSFRYIQDSKTWRNHRNDEIESRYTGIFAHETTSFAPVSYGDRSPPGVWNGVFGARRRSTVTQAAFENMVGKDNANSHPRRPSNRADIVNNGNSMMMHPGTLVYTDTGRPPPLPRVVAGPYKLQDCDSPQASASTASSTHQSAPETPVTNSHLSQTAGSRPPAQPFRTQDMEPNEAKDSPVESKPGLIARIVDIRHASSFSVRDARVPPLFQKKVEKQSIPCETTKLSGCSAKEAPEQVLMTGESAKSSFVADQVRQACKDFTTSLPEQPSKHEDIGMAELPAQSQPRSRSGSQVSNYSRPMPIKTANMANLEETSGNQAPRKILISPELQENNTKQLPSVHDAVISPLTLEKPRRWSWSADDDTPAQIHGDR